MIIKKYSKWINEEFELSDIKTSDNDLSAGNEDKKPMADKYETVLSDVSDLIKKSVKSEDDKVFTDFIDAYIKDSESSSIEGLINDSDIYEFYLKYRDDIDDILNDIKWYDESPASMTCYGVYDYIIKSTKKAVTEFVTLLKK